MRNEYSTRDCMVLQFLLVDNEVVAMVAVVVFDEATGSFVACSLFK